MKMLLKTLFVIVLLAPASQASAESDPSDEEALKIAAVEALISAPPERALPLARKVVEGNYSDDLKERALFVLSQIDDPEAQELILVTARNSSGDLQEEAIRMIGIGGDPDALALDASDPDNQEMAIEGFGIIGSEAADATLLEIYRSAANEEVREAALDGLMISGNDEAVLELYRASSDAAEKRMLLEYLVNMGSEEVWQLIDQALDGGR